MLKKPLCLFPGKLYNKAVQVFGSVETNSTVRTNCFTFEREIQNDIYHLYAKIFTHLTIEVEKSISIFISIYIFLLVSYVTSNEKQICANISNSNSWFIPPYILLFLLSIPLMF